MISKLKMLSRQLGFMLISYSIMFQPMYACADDDTSIGVVLGFPVGALVTGFILVNMSRTKSKATKAEKYIKGQLELNEKGDQFLRKEMHKIRINND
ncbi:MAG: hypothetical protein LUE12_09470 [Ruminococcus sp.]|nr:hypothetical protein [Ruminococcus sp.]